MSGGSAPNRASTQGSTYAAGHLGHGEPDGLGHAHGRVGVDYQNGHACGGLSRVRVEVLLVLLLAGRSGQVLRVPPARPALPSVTPDPPSHQQLDRLRFLRWVEFGMEESGSLLLAAAKAVLSGPHARADRRDGPAPLIWSDFVEGGSAGRGNLARVAASL